MSIHCLPASLGQWSLNITYHTYDVYCDFSTKKRFAFCVSFHLVNWDTIC